MRAVPVAFSETRGASFADSAGPSASLGSASNPVVTSVSQPCAPVTQVQDRTFRSGTAGIQPQGRTYRTPATPPKPSFFSYMFGGSARITSPEGNLVGYYDHDAGKVAMQMTAAYAEIAPLFHPAGWMEVGSVKAGTPLLQAIDHGISEALQKHHPVPLHMGGRYLQELAPLRKSLHVEFHSMLRSAFKDAGGFLHTGGKGGARADWVAFFEANPERYSEALEILQRVTREFDKARGAKVSMYLDRELARMAERTRRGP